MQHKDCRTKGRHKLRHDITQLASNLLSGPPEGKQQAYYTAIQLVQRVNGLPCLQMVCKCGQVRPFTRKVARRGGAKVEHCCAGQCPC